MNTVQLIIVCVSALAALVIVTQASGKRTAAAAPSELAPAPTFSPPNGARVAVNKLDGQTLRGEIASQSNDEVVLAKVDVIVAGESTPTGGQFHITRDRIDSIQVL